MILAIEGKNTPPKWFWIVSSTLLIWNLLGVLAFLGHIMITPEMIAQMPEAQKSLYENVPAWVNYAFALGVFAGTIGCLLLLLRKSPAFLH